MSKFKPVQVKICGLTNVEDAKWVVNLGADYVGLNFCPDSPRRVSADKALEVVNSLPSFVKSVGVFVNPDWNELGKILKKAPLHILQLHGDETPEDVRRIKSELKVSVWKALRVENEESLAKIAPYQGAADIVLLDAYRLDQAGGTGQTFDWSLAVKAKESGIPVFLAGGLNPDNVLEAIQAVEPLGVDVASGVEKEGHPKKKDVEKLKVFIQRAKGMMK